jgi:hypothetical protein
LFSVVFPNLFTNFMLDFMQDNWADWLAMAEFSYKDKVHTTMGFTLFYPMLGFHLRKGTEPRVEDLLSASGANALIIDEQFSPQSASAPVPVFPATSFPVFDSESNATISIAPAAPEDNALIVHSSGTTSGPP